MFRTLFNNILKKSLQEMSSDLFLLTSIIKKIIIRNGKAISKAFKISRIKMGNAMPACRKYITGFKY